MEFKDFNDKVVKELEQKKELDNTDNKSGIYAIYIENYDYKCMKYEECIIPIYVGQSKNIYQRILSHKKKLKEIFSYCIFPTLPFSKLYFILYRNPGFNPSNFKVILSSSAIISSFTFFSSEYFFPLSISSRIYESFWLTVFGIS